MATIFDIDIQVITNKALDWVILNGADFAFRAIAALIVILIGKVLITMISAVLRHHLNRAHRVSDLMEDFMVNTCRRVGWVIIGMVAVRQVGIDIAPLIAGLGVTGFIVGFAFQETLGNFASGFMIAVNQPFTLGDFVDLNGNAGNVVETNMMATTLTTLDNKKIMIPNKNVWGSAIVNYTALDTRRVDLMVGISYGSDISKAKTVIKDTLRQIDKVLAEPEPTVEVHEMADSSINLVVRPWCKTTDYWAVYFEVNHQVKEALDREGIAIPFPQLDIHHFGNAPAPVPADLSTYDLVAE